MIEVPRLPGEFLFDVAIPNVESLCSGGLDDYAVTDKLAAVLDLLFPPSLITIAFSSALHLFVRMFTTSVLLVAPSDFFFSVPLPVVSDLSVASANLIVALTIFKFGIQLSGA